MTAVVPVPVYLVGAVDFISPVLAYGYDVYLAVAEACAEPVGRSLA